jgi:hypothetical protein
MCYGRCIRVSILLRHNGFSRPHFSATPVEETPIDVAVPDSDLLILLLQVQVVSARAGRGGRRG